MTKIRTLSQLQETLDEEMGWRIREIATLKLAVKQGGVNSTVFVRAGVALVYAHWEGFIKAASQAYLNYVDNQGCIYRELKSCFGVTGLKASLSQLSESQSAKTNIKAFDFILEQLDKPTKIDKSGAVNTESNLTSKVFANIALSLGIKTTRYETKYNLIDESLVSRRNKIAHGKRLDLHAEEFRTLADETLDMMRTFKTDLENAASLSDYKRPT